MDKWWDCKALDRFIEKVLRVDLLSKLKQDWPELKQKYGDRFFRMWEYYLLTCAGGF